MKKPVLVIMAAGMGSRYGGLKQMDPVDPQGHSIMDFSIYDARMAGFEEVVFVIKEENEADFREVIGDRVSRTMKVHYVHQKLEDLPEGFQVPEGRKKPWGTGQAVLSCADVVDGPFAVINADDYYGRQAFQLIYDYLTTHEDDTKYRYVMVGFLLRNTVTDSGYVARGVCQQDADHYLTSITERTRIEKRGEDAAFSEDEGQTWTDLPGDTIVSMNCWGFSGSFMKELRREFPVFLDKAMRENPLKGEYFLPSVVQGLLSAGQASVKLLTTPDQWYGVTYREDKAMVEQGIRKMKDAGIYPEDF